MKKNDSSFLVLLIIAAILYMVWEFLQFVAEHWYVFVLFFGVVIFFVFIWYFGKPKTNSQSTEQVVRRNFPSAESMPYETPQTDSIPYNVQTLLNVYDESYDIVTTSYNIETVDSRFGIMLDTGEQIAAIQSPELDTFRRQFYSLNTEKLLRNAAERYAAKQIEEINRLKTSKGKLNRIERISVTVGGLINFPDSLKTSLLNRIKENCNGFV